MQIMVMFKQNLIKYLIIECNKTHSFHSRSSKKTLHETDECQKKKHHYRSRKGKVDVVLLNFLTLAVGFCLRKSEGLVERATD